MTNKPDPPTLPCPHCGEPVGASWLWHDRCAFCGRVECPSNAIGSLDRVTAAWNTRFINGHKVQFQWAEPGVLSPAGVWFVIHDGYMYGPAEDWNEVVRIMMTEWRNDKHLVG